MLIVLSPAKTLDYETPALTEIATQPDFIKKSAELVAILREYSPAKIAELMHISDKLAVLNANRFADWSKKFTLKNSKQAMLAFNGDVYESLHAATLSARQLDYAQSHIRILSGLYGVLKPLDLIQPYRLEMGTKLPNPAGKDLYAFWKEQVSSVLQRQLVEKKSSALVNLASEEYFKVVQTAMLNVPVITPIFQDWKNGKYKVISFHAKRARGLMARYAVVNGLTHAASLKEFNLNGYAHDAEASTNTNWIFNRRMES